ncbi:hypothetical protein [Gordonia alkaliphila]|uniref:Uncharacterized protein n=1 Tax=Gordonia alkaliphila TaxID=1053547 RepID=A0ABP8Z4V1_9ACTN
MADKPITPAPLVAAPSIRERIDALLPPPPACRRCGRPATTQIVYGGWRWHYEIFTCLRHEEGVIDHLQALDARITAIKTI